MLKVRLISRREQVHSWIENDDFENVTWLVPDLRSKIEVQEVAIEKNGYVTDESVLRASEFWKIQLRRMRPEIRLVSTDYASSMIADLLRGGNPLGEGRAPSERLVLAAMDRFASLCFHPEGPSVAEEWLEGHPESALRWRDAYLLARWGLGQFLEQKILTSSWVAAYLLSDGGLNLQWDREIRVDLGAELTGAEAQMLLELSRSTDVVIFEPAPRWRSDFAQLLRPYDDIRGYAASVEFEPESKNSARARREFPRLPSQLAEVKEAVARVRSWLDAGVKPDKIAVLAPKIELYWPTLQAFFAEEGVPCDKALTVKLSSRPGVGRWLAHLRPRPSGGAVEAHDLETAYYSAPRDSFIEVAEFHRLFTNLYGREDLGRERSVQSYLEKNPVFSDRMKRDEFLRAVAGFWGADDETDSLEMILREVLQNAPADREMALATWVSYLDSLVSRKEMSLSSGVRGGVQVSSLQGARTRRVSHRVFLGLNEESMRGTDRQALPTGDILGLSDLGFHLDHPDQSLLDFDTRWLAENTSEENVFLVGMTDFEGGSLSPSPAWIRWRQEEGLDGSEVDLPRMTRWDALMVQDEESLRTIRGWRSIEDEARLEAIARDLGRVEPAPGPAVVPERLSPSAIIDYLKCPFRLASSVLFGLGSDEELDLDPGHADQGSLAHRLFQILVDGGYVDRDVGDDELEGILEAARRDSLELADERLWPPLKNKYLQIARRFLEIERDWKKSYPALKEVRSEIPWRIFFDPVSGKFHPEGKEGMVRISGRIDRLESDGDGYFVLVDYKKSVSGINNQSKWIESIDLQLLFYIWALEFGAVEGAKGEVIGAFYYVYRNFDRSKGLQLEGRGNRLFPERPKAAALADEDRKKEMIEYLETSIRDSVRNMAKGTWSASPVNHEICDRCSWSDLCRAPHLN